MSRFNGTLVIKRMKVDWFKTVQFLFAGQFCLKVIWRFRMEPHETAKASNRNDGLKLLLIYIYKRGVMPHAVLHPYEPPLRSPRSRRVSRIPE